jgi:glycosyltransferase involved in cell wall biosynthesis
MPTEPTISVVVPTHNRANLLPRAIRSVLAQTFEDFELIVVDDASTDETASIVRGLQGRDYRVHYLRHASNQGEAASRNTGIAAAQGEFIAFLDDDDEWLPRKLEEQLAVFSKSSVQSLGMVYCGVIFVDASTRIELGRVPPRERGDLLGNLLDHDSTLGGGSTALVKRAVFDKCGFFDTADVLRRGGSPDREMWLRMAYEYRFDFANDFLMRYYFRSGANLTANDLALRDKAEAFEYIMNKHSKLLKDYPRAASNYLYDIGRLYAFSGMVARARMYFWDALRLNASNLKAWVSLGASVLGPRFYRWAYEKVLPIWGNPDYRAIVRATRPSPGRRQK